MQRTLRHYAPTELRNGLNAMPDGEEIYFISTPSAGLWSTEEKLHGRPEVPAELAGID